ncbi:MAG TPA: hypothetical protein VFP77_11485, partial [Gemmatimonadaceae bacterium]|nr:hypothetical protein [Gemmatimonadaceae bacterium]
MRTTNRISAVAVLLAVAGCATHATPANRTAPPVNTEETAVAPDAVADTLLADVRSLDPAIIVELRYATSNNFT